MKLDIVKLAREVGFKIFGDRIVAADHSISGEATESIQRLANLIIEECAKVCETTGIKHPKQLGQEACAMAIREMKSED